MRNMLRLFCALHKCKFVRSRIILLEKYEYLNLRNIIKRTEANSHRLCFVTFPKYMKFTLITTIEYRKK